MQIKEGWCLSMIALHHTERNHFPRVLWGAGSNSPVSLIMSGFIYQGCKGFRYIWRAWENWTFSTTALHCGPVHWPGCSYTLPCQQAPHSPVSLGMGSMEAQRWDPRATQILHVPHQPLPGSSCKWCRTSTIYPCRSPIGDTSLSLALCLCIILEMDWRREIPRKQTFQSLVRRREQGKSNPTLLYLSCNNMPGPNSNSHVYQMHIHKMERLQKDLHPSGLVEPESENKRLPWLPPSLPSVTIVTGNFAFTISKWDWSYGLLQLDTGVRALVGAWARKKMTCLKWRLVKQWLIFSPSECLYILLKCGHKGWRKAKPIGI